MRYEQKYNDDDFLHALDNIKLKTAGFVAKKIGCTLPTAKGYLKSLAERNLIESIAIDEGQIIAYKLNDK